MVHNLISRTIETDKKEEILLEIERQWDLGDARLLEEDKYLAKVNSLSAMDGHDRPLKN
jgi:hypothetical protein